MEWKEERGMTPSGSWILWLWDGMAVDDGSREGAVRVLEMKLSDGGRRLVRISYVRM